MTRLSKALFVFSAILILAASCGGGGDKGSPSPGPYVPPANVAVSSVSISVTAKEIVIGETLQLSATVSPSNATDKTITWSTSSSTVATVSPTGLVTGKAEGTADIKATAGGKSSTCKVTVKKPTVAVSSVELDETNITLKEGETKTLKVTVKPDNATDKTVTWGSSKTDVATVDNTGKVSAIKEGVASITATSGGKSASCKVTVEKAVVEVTSITLSETSVTLTEGETKTITATVNPSDATDITVTWISSNSDIATVANGAITAKAPGNTTITAFCGGKEATCQVTVNPKVIEVTSITLSDTSVTLTEGETKTITATVNPSDATDKTVTWSSYNPSVATVSNGTITAWTPGSADITAECGGKTASCYVIVTTKEIPVSSISLSKTSWNLIKGESITLSVTVTPTNATDRTINWSSSDNNVVTVKNGVVSAVGAGYATVYAKSSNGKTASCYLTVRVYINNISDIGDRDDEDFE